MRSLSPAQIVETAARLERRIRERFPEAGLVRVAAELHQTAGEAAHRVADLRRPNWLVRGLVALLLVALAGLVGRALLGVRVAGGVSEWAPLAQTVEATINNLVFVGIAVLFLVGLEGRLKRRRSLRAIQELRSIAHIVDMHQLTKDPDRYVFGMADTLSSPLRPLSRFELSRYLDYCSELLSITGKVAALYGDGVDDPVVLGAVQQVEALATGLSGKIWQKILILDTSGHLAADSAGQRPPPLP